MAEKELETPKLSQVAQNQRVESFDAFS